MIKVTLSQLKVIFSIGPDLKMLIIIKWVSRDKKRKESGHQMVVLCDGFTICWLKFDYASDGCGTYLFSQIMHDKLSKLNLDSGRISLSVL